MSKLREAVTSVYVECANVHDLHVWSLTSQSHALSSHV